MTVSSPARSNTTESAVVELSDGSQCLTAETIETVKTNQKQMAEQLV